MANQDYFVQWSRQLSRDRQFHSLLSSDSIPGGMASIVEDGIFEPRHTSQSEGNPSPPDPTSVLGLDRRYALDAAALLGGNEYLVSEMLEQFSQSPFNTEELAGVFWMAKHLSASEQFLEELESREDLNQGHLTAYFSAFNRERLPRILASALLFCSRFEDTDLVQSLDNERQRAIVVSMDNYPMVEPPIGEIPARDPTSKPVSCGRVAFVYFRSKEEFPVPVFPNGEKPKSAARKISASLAHEQKMLSIVNLFAIFPVP